jgi:hypothetical protein
MLVILIKFILYSHPRRFSDRGILQVAAKMANAENSGQVIEG